MFFFSKSSIRCKVVRREMCCSVRPFRSGEPMLGTNGYIPSCKRTTTRGRDCQSKSNCMLSKPAASSTMYTRGEMCPGTSLSCSKASKRGLCVFESKEMGGRCGGRRVARCRGQHRWRGKTKVNAGAEEAKWEIKIAE